MKMTKKYPICGKKIIMEIKSRTSVKLFRNISFCLVGILLLGSCGNKAKKEHEAFMEAYENGDSIPLTTGTAEEQIAATCTYLFHVAYDNKDSYRAELGASNLSPYLTTDFYIAFQKVPLEVATLILGTNFSTEEPDIQFLETEIQSPNTATATVKLWKDKKPRAVRLKQENGRWLVDNINKVREHIANGTTDEIIPDFEFKTDKYGNFCVEETEKE